MPSRYEETIYNILSDEPVTPNEVAKKLGINYKTAKDALMYLTITRKDVRYKNSGRIYMFWKKKRNSTRATKSLFTKKQKGGKK
jgi:predicted ArsR family transcriptional regulator